MSDSARQHGEDSASAARHGAHRGYLYRAPRELRRSPYQPKRVLVVGACLSEPLAAYINGTGFNTADHIVFNHLSSIPAKTADEIASYDFQIVQIPLRSVMHEARYVRLQHGDRLPFETLLNWSLEHLEQMFEAVMRYNAEFGMMTFVHNFLIPQQNPMGRLFPKYDLRNPVFFIDQLNRRLAELAAARSNAHLLDADEIAATYGRRYVQDDGLCVTSHGSFLDVYDSFFDQERIEPPEPAVDLYQMRTFEHHAAVWHEAEAMADTLHQTDMVKMVVVDLDDTLWRGELVENGGVADHLIEGWPLGFIEALLYLKRRGILLGIISRNEEALVAPLFEPATARLLRLDDFASRRINWAPKPDNMMAMLAETNLLAANVVYIDDHPVQRAAMQEAFPEMRVLGRDPYYLRRILLWSPETQGVGVTDESARRTSMVQAQAAREAERKLKPRAEFLQGLGLRLTLGRMTASADPAFPRAFELLNKTNQFNTTGRRWTLHELDAFFEGGGSVIHGSVEDSYTAYGLVWLALIQDRTLAQAVMSCRVAGLDVELAAMAAVCQAMIRDQGFPVLALSAETEKNLLSRDLFERCGFTRSGPDAWRLDGVTPPAPAHIPILEPQAALVG